MSVAVYIKYRYKLVNMAVLYTCIALALIQPWILLRQRRTLMNNLTSNWTRNMWIICLCERVVYLLNILGVVYTPAYFWLLANERKNFNNLPLLIVFFLAYTPIYMQHVFMLLSHEYGADPVIKGVHIININ